MLGPNIDSDYFFFSCLGMNNRYLISIVMTKFVVTGKQLDVLVEFENLEKLSKDCMGPLVLKNLGN